jgi:radical SAM protein with 4Fe4S-binding SPASM domain
MVTALKTTIPLFERLQIESQANCNRACWFCPRTYDRSGKYLDESGASVSHRMPTETILDLLEQAAALGFRGRVGFHHYSEPLLDRRNVMLAREARASGMRPYLHTNGDVLRHNDELCREVVDVYELIVVGVYDYDCNDELEAEKRYWRRRLDGANLEFSPIARTGARAAHSIGVPRALVPSDPRMAAPDLTFAAGPCHRPLVRMIVQHDGEMSNCCEDTQGAFRLGNVHESSLEELWFSERHIRIVEDLLAGHRERHGLCRNCPLPPTGPARDGRRIVLARRRYQESQGPAPTESGPAEPP